MLERVRIPGLGGWEADPLWGHAYDWSVEHPAWGRPAWQLFVGSDLRLLYDAAAEIGRQRSGSAVLDVPCGGGVALRGLRAEQEVRYVAADISAQMLGRTMRVATERGLAAQVEAVQADVARLPFGDGEFDLVVSFTGLHCFPDPHAAILELGRVTHPDGTITGSGVLNDTGLRHLPMRTGGRFAGLLGPGATEKQLRGWLHEAGFGPVTLRRSGAIAYFRAPRTR